MITLRIAVRALARNRLRTLLTILGIMVGIAAVICTVALGQGSADQIQQQMANLGDNFIWIENGSAQRRRRAHRRGRRRAPHG